MGALTKVANYVDQTDVGSLLRTQMLGTISNLNNMLQDVQMKRPSEAKAKILKSLGPFIEQIGPPISNIAPQVRYFPLVYPKMHRH